MKMMRMETREREREREQANKKELTKILDTVYTKKADHQNLRENPSQG